MIDSIRFGRRFQLGPGSKLYDDLEQMLRSLTSHGRYVVESHRINFAQCKQRGIMYQSKLKVKDKNSSRYLYAQYEKVAGYKNIYDFKWNTEITLFDDLDDFFCFVYGIFPDNKMWKFYLNQSCILDIHLKVDIRDTRLDLDFFRRHAFYPYPKFPRVVRLVEPDDSSRTYYLSDKVYFYEKEDFVRLEIRLTKPQIINFLKLEQLDDLWLLDVQKVTKIFERVSIHNLVIKRNELLKLLEHQRLFAVMILQFIEDPTTLPNISEYQLMESKKGILRISFNSLQCAKEYLEEWSPGDFSYLIKKIFKNINFKWKFLIEQELHDLKGDKNERK